MLQTLVLFFNRLYLITRYYYNFTKTNLCITSLIKSIDFSVVSLAIKYILFSNKHYNKSLKFHTYICRPVIIVQWKMKSTRLKIEIYIFISLKYIEGIFYAQSECHMLIRNINCIQIINGFFS